MKKQKLWLNKKLGTLWWMLSIFIFSSYSLAAIAPEKIALEKVYINLHDQATIERGALFFASHCMTCHTLKYLQYDNIAKKAGIVLSKMPLQNKKWWLDIVPPDLTLMAQQKGANWLYTYFHAFYRDASRSTGYNNLIAPNINMMNVFAPLQGNQELDKNFLSAKQDSFSKPHYYSILETVQQGSLSPEEFDATMTDLVNFLVYASDPHRAERERIGVWVLIFLGFFVVVTLLLMGVYWKKV